MWLFNTIWLFLVGLYLMCLRWSRLELFLKCSYVGPTIEARCTYIIILITKKACTSYSIPLVKLTLKILSLQYITDLLIHDHSWFICLCIIHNVYLSLSQKRVSFDPMMDQLSFDSPRVKVFNLFSNTYQQK